MAKFKKWDNTARYEKQSKIIADALGDDDHALDRVLEGMEEGKEAAIYLCGGQLDNDYCFGSGDVAVVLSKLPEDGFKAALPGYHPGSTEVYVVFQGSLIIEFLDGGTLKTVNYGQFDIAVIPPGQCHRVRNEPGRRAASLIVKTNPRHKPGAVRCDNCIYHPNGEGCILFTSLKHEDRELGISR